MSSDPVDLSESVRPSADVLTRAVGDELVLLVMATEQYYALDDIGAAMWNAIIDSPDLRSARDRLLAEFDASADELTRDLLELVDELRTLGIVTTDAG